MSLLHPLALAWAAVALPIVALYILRIRRRRQAVPSLMFWAQIFQDTAPRSLWRRLRHWLSLMMQLALLVLLALALAEPVSTGAANRPRHYVVVMDRSASMQAKDADEGSRFDEARGTAHRIVRAMRDQDEMTLIGSGVDAAIACGRTHHQPTLHAAIDALSAIDVPVDLKPALRLGRSIDVGNADRVIVALTDSGGLKQIGELADASVRVHRCGGHGDNVAITGFAVRPRLDNPLEMQGILRVANFSDKAATAEVRMTRDGELFDVIIAELAAGEEKLQAFQMMNTGGGELRARLTKDDALPIDNEAVAFMPDSREKSVLLVSEAHLFLESVLASHPWMKVTRLKPDEYTAASLSKADIVVFHEHVPGAVPDRPCLFVHPTRESDLWTLAGELTNPLVSDLAKDSELLQHVNLRNVTFHRAAAVMPRKAGQAIVTSFDRPLLMSWASASPPVVLLTVDINQSDLPWRTAFPILVQNTLNYLAGRTEDLPSAHRTGEIVSVAMSGAAAVATDQAGRPVALVLQDGYAAIGPVASAGIVTVNDGQASHRLAFNLADSAESDIRQSGTGAPGAVEASSMPAEARPWSWPWWVTLAICAVALSVMEWCLHQRRVID